MMYALPPNFLKDTLNITNTRYPDLTVGAAARADATSSTTLLTALKATLRERAILSASSTPQ